MGQFVRVIKSEDVKPSSNAPFSVETLINLIRPDILEAIDHTTIQGHNAEIILLYYPGKSEIGCKLNKYGCKKFDIPSNSLRSQKPARTPTTDKKHRQALATKLIREELEKGIRCLSINRAECVKVIVYFKYGQASGTQQDFNKSLGEVDEGAYSSYHT